MPLFEEHCKRTFSRYGVSGGIIHRWMDEPCKIYGPSHRRKRHDKDQKLPKEHTDKHGEELAYNIMLDHILDDNGTKENNGENDEENLEQIKENMLVLRREVVRLNNIIKDNDVKNNNLISALKGNIKKLENESDEERREWKTKFVIKFCNLYSEMVKNAVKKSYTYNGRFIFQCPHSVYDKAIEELEDYYKRLYVLDDLGHPTIYEPEKILDRFGREVMKDVFETIENGVEGEVAIFRHQMLRTDFDPRCNPLS